MNNDFINLTGAWPEGYFFTDKKGFAKWGSTVKMTGMEDMGEAYQYLQGLNGKKKGNKKCTIFWLLLDQSTNLKIKSTLQKARWKVVIMKWLIIHLIKTYLHLKYFKIFIRNFF